MGRCDVEANDLTVLETACCREVSDVVEMAPVAPPRISEYCTENSSRSLRETPKGDRLTVTIRSALMGRRDATHSVGRRQRRAAWRLLPAPALIAAMLTACGGGGGGSSPSAPGVTSKTITIGLEVDATGVLASTFAGGTAGAQARVALQNAQGGVDGRKLVLDVTDTQSSPIQFPTNAKLLVSKGVFGIVSDSALTFTGAPYLTKAGVPVTGSELDGPEWGTSANMFTYSEPLFTTYNGKSYNYNTASKLLKQLGVTKVAALGYSVPSAVTSVKQLVTADSRLGLQSCYVNTTVPIGGVDFTADLLQIKQAGCDAVVGTFIEASNVALAEAVRNAGLNAEVLTYTAYTPETLKDSGAVAALQGTYTQGTLAGTQTAAERAMAAFETELKQYDPSYSGGVPEAGAQAGWEAVDVMIKGLELAGHNPTRAAFISKLRTVQGYTLLGAPVSFEYLTGHLPSTQCTNYVQLEGSGFVPYPADGSPICGDLVMFSGSGS
jgi:ABC-type branched-subunit amino acid transport system substrate-binding protein